jgi:putative tryptophan/tyrosine transport system substrate-binding protein
MSDLLTGNRQYCLDKAADCERKAAQAPTPTQRKSFKPLPQGRAWQRPCAISIIKLKTFCGPFEWPHNHDGFYMWRRDFIRLLGGAAAWPIAAQAQQPTVPLIGFLGPALNTRRHWLAEFGKGLGVEGFVEGQNVTIEYRSANGGPGGLPELAADLVRRQVAVIFASGPPAAAAAKRATQTIPIVFVSGGDPVQMGLVSSFHRPNGNVTGFYFLATELVAKRLALLHELLPRAKRVAVLVNPSNVATAEPTVRDVAIVGRALSLDIQVYNAST